MAKYISEKIIKEEKHRGKFPERKNRNGEKIQLFFGNFLLFHFIIKYFVFALLGLFWVPKSLVVS